MILRGFHNDDVSCQQSGGDFGSSKHKREVPGNDGSDNAKGCVSCDNLSSIAILNDFFGKIKARLSLDPSNSGISLAVSLRDLYILVFASIERRTWTYRLSLLRCEKLSKFLLLSLDGICPSKELLSSLLPRDLGPRFEGLSRSVDGVVQVILGGDRNFGLLFESSRVYTLVGLLSRGAFAIDDLDVVVLEVESLCAVCRHDEQRRVIVV